MYAWLADALGESSQVVTASQRLARTLANEFAQQQLALGRAAWRSPQIVSWRHWLASLLSTATLTQTLPAQINAHQSRVLWERCLRREISDPLLNMPLLVRQARESWARLHEFEVPLQEVAQSALGRDQNIFARAAGAYRSILHDAQWTDEAGVAAEVLRQLRNGALPLPERVTIAGFDRLTPQVKAVLGAMDAAGVSIVEAPTTQAPNAAVLHRYENPDAEMRAAGAWAHEQLIKTPERSVAIVVTGLERDADRSAGLIREGFAPGWQIAKGARQASVNVSYGRKLSSYPAIAIALTALRWLHSDLPGREISLLLRSPAIGIGSAGRSRLELQLRQVPDRAWSPARVLGVLEGRDDAADAVDWLRRVASVGALRRDLPRRAAPSRWVELTQEILGALNWPGEQALDSNEFQLINRWRELLNDLARLQLVSPTMTYAEVLARLGTMASDTLFQPESEGAIVQVLGPLEAAGMQFDKLLITGLSANNWPPSARPSPLLSRELQRQFGMPDADPDDTLDYARRVLTRLLGSAADVEVSFAVTDEDAEQTECALLDGMLRQATATIADPGWFAGQLVDTTNLEFVARDPVPAVSEDESISGGAATINRQLHEPFSAFAHGRLGIRPLQRLSSGLAANMRGSLIHDALQRLYADCPAQDSIAGWNEKTTADRIHGALRGAFARHERHADAVLTALLQLERDRDARLLRQIVRLDRQREPFSIAAVETSLDIDLDGLRLGLRIDRIDRLEGGTLVILDYKTGSRRAFLGSDGVPNDLQLVVYACAMTDPVAGLGLVNIDSRSVDLDGAGSGFTRDIDWPESLAAWQQLVHETAAEIHRGDVRINGVLSRRASRALSLLTRIAELKRDH